MLVIFVTVFIDLIGFGIVIPVLPYYVEGTKFHASTRMVGLLFAAYSVMQLICAPVLGRLSDKYGRRPILFISLLGTSLGFLIMGVAWTLWMLFLGRLIDGITGGNISVAYAYIADITTTEDRARGMGVIGAAFGMGFTFGPAIGGILSKWGISVPLYFAAGMAFCNAILLYFVLPETVDKEHPARVSAATGRWTQLVKALQQSRLAFVLSIYFLFVVAFSIMTASFALFTMYRFGFDASQNGYVFAMVGVVGAIIQGGLIGRLVKRFGELPLTITGAFIFTLSLFTIPLIGPNTGWLMFILVGGGFAIGNSLATPSLTSLASKSVGPAEQGSVLGVTQSAASLARVVGPTLSSLLIYSALQTQGADGNPHNMSDHTLFATFWTASAIMFLAFLIALYFARSHAAEYAGREVAPVRG
jgi:DHA1 family tetracycline resistance protein-like MFS transporter